MKWSQMLKSQHSNIRNMKKKNTTYPSSQITNHIVMKSSKSELDVIPDREFKRINLSMFKEMNEEVSAWLRTQENKRIKQGDNEIY